MWTCNDLNFAICMWIWSLTSLWSDFGLSRVAQDDPDMNRTTSVVGPLKATLLSYVSSNIWLCSGMNHMYWESVALIKWHSGWHLKQSLKESILKQVMCGVLELCCMRSSPGTRFHRNFSLILFQASSISRYDSSWVINVNDNRTHSPSSSVIGNAQDDICMK